MYKTHGFVKDMSMAKLLEMREAGMSNREIAAAQGCSYWSIHNLIGPQPPEMTLANRSKATTKSNVRRGGAGVRKVNSFMHPEDAQAAVKDEPQITHRAVLVKKNVAPQPIPMHGEFMDYTISADRQMVDVETEKGRCLIQIPIDKIGLFIEELDAIRRNAAVGENMVMWG